MNKQSEGLAIVSLILGIISIVCCCAWYMGCITGIAGLAIGIVAYRNEENAQHSFSIAGIITSSVGLAFSLFMILFLVFMMAISGDAGTGTNVTPSQGTGSALQFLLNSILRKQT